MSNKFKIISTITVLLVGMFLLSSCSKKVKLAKKGEKCGKIECIKGLKCWQGKCEDVSGKNPDCEYLRKASKGLVNSNPQEILKGIHYSYDTDVVSGIPSDAAKIYGAFANGLPQKECKRIIACELPKLCVGCAWYWTRAAFAETQKIAPGSVKVPANPIKVITATTDQKAIGDDANTFPPVKIKQMAKHKFGCMAKVQVRVKEDFTGFVTFHFWKNSKCTFKETKNKKKNGESKWVCTKKEKLTQANYTYTVYLFPFRAADLKSKKGAKKKTYLTGNQGTYLVDVWAYSPINEKEFPEHKQWKNIEKFKKKNPGAIRCPEYGEDAFNNGCGCIGFVKNKITVTVNPDPFMLLEGSELCKEDEVEKKKE
jgi:hypothetical protein